MSEPFVSICLPGIPRGQGRVRARIVQPKGRPPFVHMYMQKEDEEYAGALADVARLAMMGMPVLQCAVSVLVEAFLPVPDSWSNKKRGAALAGDLPHISKPDIDNIQKFLDAFKGIVWKDDSQIVLLQGTKVYDEMPRLRVTVWIWDDVPRAEPQADMLKGDFD